MTTFEWQSLVFAWRYAARRKTAAAEHFIDLVVDRFGSEALTDVDRKMIARQFCNVDFRKGGEAYAALSAKWKSAWETLCAGADFRV